MKQQQTASIARFTCLGDACPDTCCQGWAMQMDQATLNKYANEAPALLDAVALPDALDSTAPPAMMRRDPVTDTCVRFESGWCAIHRSNGSDFLGDACHFYPRVVRKFSDVISMTGTLSCPEMARLMLVEPHDSLALLPMDLPRLPHHIKDYAPEGISSSDALAVQHVFVQGVMEAGTPRYAMLMLHAAAQSLEGFAPQQWLETAPMALKFASSRIAASEPNPSDVLNLLLALCGLMQAANKTHHRHLRPMVQRIADLLACELTLETLALEPSYATEARLDTLAMRVEMLPWLPHFLQRWLQAQLNVAAFPFAGFGRTLGERGTIIGVRMATLLLAVLARAEAEGEGMTIAHAAEEAQILARFMDHLADPEYSMQIYAETGWVRIARLRALLEGLGLR